ncbi:MAG: sulfatase-like hydrolase/transferase [Fuerstiella sp.]|nr:sulfatase-like hydrolase/transferase [Fuerstiella sp.]
MKSIQFVFAIILVLTAGLQAREKPNVIVVMADDIGFECYSAFGSEFYQTPNIDKLAATGAKLTQAYSQPICTPSRVRIMTGRYNFRNYTQFGELDLAQPTFASMVKANGYATAIAGKWQLSAGDLGGPGTAGFDEYCLWHFSRGGSTGHLPEIFRNKGSRYKSPTLFRNGTLVSDTAGKYGPDMVSDFICDFIERRKDEPFVVYYPMILVHNPFDPTPDSRDWEQKDASREPLEHFREMVHYMDKVVGKIVGKLDAVGVREDTLIMVTGDNGTNRSLTSPFPSRGSIQGGKGTMKDAGNRIAFVANWPGQIQSGTVVDLPVGFSDVLPTIADVTGSEVPAECDGQSFLPLLRGDTGQARGWLFQSYSKNGPGKAPYRCFVRNAEWKLYANGALFNVPNDWLEETPIMGAQGKSARRQLQPILDRILQDVPPELIDRRPMNSASKR